MPLGRRPHLHSLSGNWNAQLFPQVQLGSHFSLIHFLQCEGANGSLENLSDSLGKPCGVGKSAEEPAVVVLSCCTTKYPETYSCTSPLSHIFSGCGLYEHLWLKVPWEVAVKLEAIGWGCGLI